MIDSILEVRGFIGHQADQSSLDLRMCNLVLLERCKDPRERLLGSTALGGEWCTSTSRRVGRNLQKTGQRELVRNAGESSSRS